MRWREVAFRRHAAPRIEDAPRPAGAPSAASRPRGAIPTPSVAPAPRDELDLLAAELFRRDKIVVRQPERRSPAVLALGERGAALRDAPRTGKVAGPADGAEAERAPGPLLPPPPLPHGGAAVAGGLVERVRAVESSRGGFSALVRPGK